MPYTRKQLPKYCRHKSTGQAFVRIGGKMHYLGKFGSQRSLGTLSMDWSVRGLRWRIVSQNGNSHEEDWSQKKLIYVDDSDANGSELQIHFRDAEPFSINGERGKKTQPTDLGAKWSVPLNKYRIAGNITLRLHQGEDCLIVHILKYPLLDSIIGESIPAGLTIQWGGEVPRDSVLMIWEPHKPGNTFHAFSLEESHRQSKSFEIKTEDVKCDLNAPLCCTIRSKYPGQT